MAGVIVVDYTGAQSKAILRTIYDCIPRVGLHHTIPGPRHGKKSLSTPLGCRTTTTLTNGNGNRQCDSLLSPLPLIEIALVLVRLNHVASYSLRKRILSSC